MDSSHSTTTGARGFMISNHNPELLHNLVDDVSTPNLHHLQGDNVQQRKLEKQKWHHISGQKSSTKGIHHTGNSKSDGKLMAKTASKNQPYVSLNSDRNSHLHVHSGNLENMELNSYGRVRQNSKRLETFPGKEEDINKTRTKKKIKTSNITMENKVPINHFPITKTKDSTNLGMLSNSNAKLDLNRDPYKTTHEEDAEVSNNKQKKISNTAIDESWINQSNEVGKRHIVGKASLNIPADANDGKRSEKGDRYSSNLSGAHEGLPDSTSNHKPSVDHGGTSSVTNSYEPSTEHILPFAGTRGHHFTITYWFFYPYNKGKRICTTNVWLFGRMAKPLFNGQCLGQNIDMGNHVGDWEHFSIFFEVRA